MFSWVTIHREAAGKLLEFRNSQDELLSLLHEMAQNGLTVIGLADKDSAGREIPLAEIDPFTFFASFNRGITQDNRRDNWSFLRTKWNLQADVPSDFDGIPVVHNQKSWFFPFAADREQGHVDLLWQVAGEGVQRPLDHMDPQVFNRCLALKGVSINNLTIGLFWLNPRGLLSADGKNTAYGAASGVEAVPADFLTYGEWLRQMTDAFGNDYPAISRAAHVFSTKLHPGTLRYWVMALGENADYWDECYEGGFAAMGWSDTGDLRGFTDKEGLRLKLVELHPGGTKKTNDALACWQFANDMHTGDVVFSKRGLSAVLGHGVVMGDYEFDTARPHFKHVRRVDWKTTGQWAMPDGIKLPMKTLTDVTPYPELVQTIIKTIGGAPPPPPPDPPPSTVSYWWLNANPTLWDLEASPVGSRQTYTSHNEKGNKRQKYRYFQEVKPGDVIIGYVTSPQKEVVALCRITKGLHGTTEGESIEFEKTERLGNPIPYSTLQGHPDLVECEPIVSNQGSLFRLTEAEFEIIRVLIDEANPPAPPPPKPYTKQMAMDGLFMPGQQFEDMLVALRERKNLVLQGAPGVGKTFVAKRLAYALIGLKSPQQVEMIQFHQSYAYEDFIQGFRPTPKGNFDLKPGVFYQFCRRAQRDEAQRKPYVFIIDEINRGNLSKIFGELMLLIEADKRGKQYAIPLAYASDADDRFYIPDNLYFVGTMNTADRSLALVDYALRRRFRFITLRPEYKAKAFTAWLDATGVAPALVQKIVERMDALNEAITKDTKNLGAGYQIGHSYFCPTGHGQPDEDWYRRVVESEIIPMIEEYWFDDDDRVKKLRSMLLA